MMAKIKFLRWSSANVVSPCAARNAVLVQDISLSATFSLRLPRKPIRWRKGIKPLYIYSYLPIIVLIIFGLWYILQASSV